MRKTHQKMDDCQAKAWLRAQGIEMRRDKPQRRCWGVIAQYPLDGKVDMRAMDERILRAARKAVPRIPRDGVDTSAGPFCPRRVKKCPPALRSVEIDTVSLRRGLTTAEKNRLAKAVRAAGARPQVKKDFCTIAEFDRGTPKVPMFDPFGVMKKRAPRISAQALERELVSWAAKHHGRRR